MARVSPTLKQDIRDYFLAYDKFMITEERIAYLKTPLHEWKEVYKIKWDSSPYVFFNDLIACLPVAGLKAALQAAGASFGVQDEPRVATLCARADEEAAYFAEPGADWLTGHYQEQIDWLETTRYQIDNRFVKLTLLIDQGPEVQGLRFVQDSQHDKYDNLNTLLGKAGDGAFVLLGGPGSGKTTLLRRLQLERAWEGLKAPSDHRIPFFVSLNGYRGRSADPPDPMAWLAKEWQQRYPALPAFEPLLKTGRLLLLLDGLNEIPYRSQEDYQEQVHTWQSFLQYAVPLGNLAVFSCRSLDYSAPLSSEAVPVRQVRVEPLSPAQIESFLRVYLTDEDSERVWHRLRQSEQQLTLFATPFFLRLLVAQVATTGQPLTSRVALLTGFVRRALHREVERRQSLFVPGTLLTANDIRQVTQNKWPTEFALPRQGLLMPKLAQLAYTMQADHINTNDRFARGAGQVRVSEEVALDILDHPQAAALIQAGIQLNVLDEDLIQLEVTYFHQLLQEYFAARVLAENPEPARVAVPWRADELTPSLAEEMARLEQSDPLPPPPATGWEETTLMAAAMNAEPDEFVRRLMPLNLVLAARCAAASEGGVSQSQGDAIRQALRQRLADPDTDLRVRIAMAEALGDLGDPRFARHNGPHGAYLLPPFVAIAGGAYPIGDDDSSYDREKPAHEVVLHPLEMAIFPVTNAEYALFMAAGGYEDEQWWHTEAAKAWLRGESGSEDRKQNAREFQAYLQGFSDDTIRQQNVSPDQIAYWLWLKHASSTEVDQQFEKWYPSGKKYRQPAYWEDGRFNHRAQPVVGITWFEANAYCAWLSAQTGRTYTLPTEVEWEAAAGGRNGRVYAYGDTFAATWGNTFETHIRRPTPVGVFPQGSTPEGIFDLSGTVWEWTSTIWGKELQNPDFNYPYVGDDGRENQEDGTLRRVVRGGSWGNAQDNARVAYRDSRHPAGCDGDFGFRVVCRPPSQDH